MAKLLAYADCTIIALANDDPRLCDCNKIINADDIPVSANQPDKQRDISLKADWKYLGETVYHFSRLLQTTERKPLYSTEQSITEQFPRSIFHPPQV